MKITNFKLIEIHGSWVDDWRFVATVDVKKGFFSRKTKKIIERSYRGSWFYRDSGWFVDPIIAPLERAYKSKKNKRLQDCLGHDWSIGYKKIPNNPDGSPGAAK